MGTKEEDSFQFPVPMAAFSGSLVGNVREKDISCKESHSMLTHLLESTSGAGQLGLFSTSCQALRRA